MAGPSLDITALYNALEQIPEQDPLVEFLDLEGFLLGGSANTLRVVTGGWCLEFYHEDVLEVVEIEQVELATLAAPLRVKLKRGARLCNMSSAAIYAPLLSKPKLPFAYASRGMLPEMQEAKKFRTLEESFREKYNLT
jgi:hypothetical protein